MPPRPTRSRKALACSAAWHIAVFGAAAWSSSGTYEALLPVSSLHTNRSYAVQYIVLTKSDPITGALPDTRQSTPERAAARAAAEPAAQASTPVEPSLLEWTAQSTTPAPRAANVSLPGGLTAGRMSAAPKATTSAALAAREPPTGGPNPPVQSAAAQELRPGQVAGIGQVESTPGSESHDATGILDKLGFRPPTPEELGSSKRGDDRVAELVTGTSSACPELTPPSAWPRPTLAVSVAFVVDTNGVVDPGSMRVVESPGHPQSDRRYHAHVYVVAATMRPDAAPIDPVRYDSLVTHEMTSHAVDLTFRPALEDGQPVRSSVLISCQMLQPT